MILRRVMQHVREQNWFAVGIDFVIVVVGVFIGIQVANWNEAQGERLREAKYLERIAADLRADIVEIDEIDRIATVRMSALTRLAWTPADGPVPDAFDSARGRIPITPVPPFVDGEQGSAGAALFVLTTLKGNRSAFDALISTGDMVLIRDASILGEIQSYYAQVDSVRDFESDLKASRLTLVESQRLAGLSPVDELSVAELASHFVADGSLRAAARNYWLYTNRHLHLMAELRNSARTLAGRLEGAAP